MLDPGASHKDNISSMNEYSNRLSRLYMPLEVLNKWDLSQGYSVILALKRP